MKIPLICCGAAIAIAAAAAPLAPAPHRTQAWPHADQYDVRIRRDEWGVPHILGRTDADAAFGLGYAQSEDDFLTVQEAVFTARGRLAELKGEAGLINDLIVRAQDIGGVVERRYAADLSPAVRRILDAYADGINAYARQHPSAAAAGLLPVTGPDLAAYIAHLGLFFSGTDSTFQAVLASKSQSAARTEMTAKGSNGLAVAPARSADGATRLLVNSHQPFTGPVAWYEAVVESREGWHVAGGFFPGVPFMLHGHNAALGWASTVNAPDVTDTYVLTLNPKDPAEYRLDGRWRRLEAQTVGLRVKRGDRYEVETREMLRSAHGPVFQAGDKAIAIRFAGLDTLKQAEFFYRLNKARSLAEWRTALAMGVWPSINYTYADAKGNIGYIYNAQFPLRQEGLDWTGVLPGDRSDLIWTRNRPAAQLPQIWNPKAGYVFNSNNTPFSASDPAEDLSAANFSKTLGIETRMTNRAYRVLETYGRDSSITAAEFDRYKYDLEYSPKSRIAGIVQTLVTADPGGDPDLKRAQAILRSWDLRTDRDNRAAALALTTALAIATGRQTDPTKALSESIRYLTAHFGRIDPLWGEVNRLRRGRVDLPVDGGPDVYRAIVGTPDPDGRYRANIGDSYIMFVEWDRHGRLSSKSVHQFGSATLDVTSPHYADQSPLFAAHKTKPVLFTESQLRGHIREDYRPGQQQAHKQHSE